MIRMIRTVETVLAEIDAEMRKTIMISDLLVGMDQALRRVKQRLGSGTPVLEAGGRPILIPVPRFELRRVAARAYLGIDADAEASDTVIEELLREPHEVDVIIDAILKVLGLELLGRVKDLRELPVCPDCGVSMRRLEEEEKVGDLGLGSMCPARVVWICDCIPGGEEGEERARGTMPRFTDREAGE